MKRLLISVCMIKLACGTHHRVVLSVTYIEIFHCHLIFEHDKETSMLQFTASKLQSTILSTGLTQRPCGPYLYCLRPLHVHDCSLSLDRVTM